MKIIGQIPGLYSTENKYIVEMTETEVKIATCHNTGAGIFVNSEFKVSERYKRLMKLENNRDQLNSIIRQLRAIADILEPLENIVSCPEELKPEENK